MNPVELRFVNNVGERVGTQRDSVAVPRVGDGVKWRYFSKTSIGQVRKVLWRYDLAKNRGELVVEILVDDEPLPIAHHYDPNCAHCREAR